MEIAVFHAWFYCYALIREHARELSLGADVLVKKVAAIRLLFICFVVSKINCRYNANIAWRM